VDSFTILVTPPTFCFLSLSLLNVNAHRASRTPSYLARRLPLTDVPLSDSVRPTATAEHTRLSMSFLARIGRRIAATGGPGKAISHLIRVGKVPAGTLIGQDEHGNRYFEDHKQVFGESRWG
jgi:hypothetical protein